MAQETEQSKESTVVDAESNLLRTDFMAEFTAAFIGSDAIPPWPARGQAKASILDDFQTFTCVLTSTLFALKPPTAGNLELSVRIVNFLKEKKWPASTPIPERWQHIKHTVRLVEIAVITDRLLKAINSGSSDAQGPAPGWPPH
jgi:hypothetical protein